MTNRTPSNAMARTPGKGPEVIDAQVIDITPAPPRWLTPISPAQFHAVQHPRRGLV